MPVADIGHDVTMVALTDSRWYRTHRFYKVALTVPLFGNREGYWCRCGGVGQAGEGGRVVQCGTAARTWDASVECRRGGWTGGGVVVG